jgi:hypothetical protein
MTKENTKMSQRILGAVDLAIDFATLGEYGLTELELPADAGTHAGGPCRERSGRKAGWESFARARRGACPSPQRSAAPRSTNAISSRPTSSARSSASRSMFSTVSVSW